MTNTNQKKQDDNKNTVSPIITSVAGAVAIAGVAVAATMALRDEKTRKKVKKVLTNVKDQAIDYVESLKEDSDVGEGIHAIKKIATDIKAQQERQILADQEAKRIKQEAEDKAIQVQNDAQK